MTTSFPLGGSISLNDSFWISRVAASWCMMASCLLGGSFHSMMASCLIGGQLQCMTASCLLGATSLYDSVRFHCMTDSLPHGGSISLYYGFLSARASPPSTVICIEGKRLGLGNYADQQPAASCFLCLCSWYNVLFASYHAVATCKLLEEISKFQL